MAQRTAQCACGHVELKVGSEPIRVLACHCDFCQKRTGSVYAVHAYFPEESVEVSGKTKIYNGLEVNGVGPVRGAGVDYHFCLTCGSTLYWILTRGNGDRDLGIAVGNFVDPGFPAPASEYNTEMRHHWVQPVAGTDQFDTFPNA